MKPIHCKSSLLVGWIATILLMNACTKMVDFSFKKTVSAKGIIFKDTTYKYDGTQKILLARNVPEGIKVTYKNDTCIDPVKAQKAIAILTIEDTSKYAWSIKQKTDNDTIILTATISMNATISTKDLFHDALYDYDGTPQKIEVEHIPKGVSVSYENNESNKIGTQTATATFTLTDPDIYEWDEEENPLPNKTVERQANLEIYHLVYPKDIIFENASYPYEAGKTRTLVATKPSSISVSYSPNTAKDFGTRLEVTATFSLPNSDYRWANDWASDAILPNNTVKKTAMLIIGFTSEDAFITADLIDGEWANIGSGHWVVGYKLDIGGPDVVIPTTINGVTITGICGEYTYELTHNQQDLETGAFPNGVKSVVIPEGVTTLQYAAFGRCTTLTSVTLPSTIKEIGYYCFFKCSGLKDFTIPNTITSIGSSAFYECTGLTSMTIPNSVTSMESGIFYSCKNLKSVTLPSNMKSIPSSMFSYCSSLTNISIPAGVTSIGASAFNNCAFSSIVIPAGVTSIPMDVFYGCSNLSSVNIPSGVTTIDDRAFYACTSLTKIVLPEGLQRIGAQAFSRTGLDYPLAWGSAGADYMKAFIIPSTVTYIGGEAFWDCPNLKFIRVQATTPPTIDRRTTAQGDPAYNNIFSGTLLLSVPQGTMNLYLAARGWRYYTGGCPSPSAVSCPGGF